MPHRRFRSSFTVAPLAGLILLTGGCERTVRDDEGGGRVTVETSSGNGDSVAGSGSIATAIAASSAGSGGDDATTSGPSGSGGGDGSGGGGGGVVEGPHVIEIALVPSTPGGDLTGTIVLVNGVGGALRHVLHAEDLPAEVEVVDGDLVTITDLVALSYPHSFDSYRVTPDVRRIERKAYAFVGSVGDPMEITLGITEIEGATHYVVETEHGHHASDLQAGPHTWEQPSGWLTPQYGIVRAEGATGTLAYAVFELPFEPGESVSLSPEMRTERATFDVDVTSLDGAEYVEANAYWWHRALNGGDFQEERLDEPSSPWSFSGSVIAPDIEGGRRLQAHVMFPEVDGRCRKASFSHEGPGNSRFTFDAAALRQPLLAGDVFTLDGPGGLGQYLGRSFDYRNGEGPGFWYVHEDPARPPLPLVFPELPREVPPGLVPDVDTMSTAGLAHVDVGVASYAAFVGRADLAFPRTTKVRSLGVCY